MIFLCFWKMWGNVDLCVKWTGSDDAENGDIVVALLNDNDVTLKKLKKDKDKIYLIPANDNYKIQSFSSDEIRIQGKLKGIIRSY